MNHINNSLNRKMYTVALFIDFKKAFDCLQYPKLLIQLGTLGLADGITSWIASYLSNRQQTTFTNKMHSNTLLVKQGVPQGSIIGPLLYTIYANDIAGRITNTKATFYADVTVLYTSSSNLDTALTRVQRDLDNLQTWCQQNGIYVNPIFSNKEVTPNVTRMLRISNAEIQRTDKYTYLGVVLDERMSFELHAKNVINRVSTKVYQLKKVRKFLSKRAALMVYKNMILPMEYGDIYLYSAT